MKIIQIVIMITISILIIIIININKIITIYMINSKIFNKKIEYLNDKKEKEHF